jgi:hypothetical protein
LSLYVPLAPQISFFGAQFTDFMGKKLTYKDLL